jgi:hypothetical protein
MGEISDPEDGKALQNFMICVEMALAGISLLYAFPHREFNMGGSTAGWRLDAFLHAISIRDVVVDTIHVVSRRLQQLVLPVIVISVAVLYGGIPAAMLKSQ